MRATEIIEPIDQLPTEEQKETLIFLTKKVVDGQSAQSASWLGKKLSFEEFCDVVVRENRELLSALAG